MAHSGSKYDPLFDHLNRLVRKTDVILSFAEIEEVLGAPLPKSARNQRGWWSNRSSGGHQARAWLDAGFKVIHIDLDKETIQLQRPGLVYHIRRRAGEVQWDAPLVKALRYQMGLSQADFAEELGVRQATVSEWETAAYRPTRSSSKLLSLIAEKAGFEYKVTASPGEDEAAGPENEASV